MVLEVLRERTLPPHHVTPGKRIFTDTDVDLWKTTQGYLDYGLFIRRLSEAVIGHYLPYNPTAESVTEAVTKTVALLNEVEGWIDEIPPQKSTQRYGNLAFREWGAKLEKEAPGLLEKLLPANLQYAVPLLLPYLNQSFGSFTRLDYGSGHELAFAMFLCSLTLIRFFQPTPEEERQLVLVVFEKYLQVVWRLQDVYRLEPAGSHGVWGLDDYCFLPYIWGSAQLQDHLTARPPDALNTPLDETTLYYQAINRIHKLKTGPFHEHSSQLHSIATGVPTWWKVNNGLLRMYETEVLGKKVVAQHVPLGGIIQWAIDEDEPDESEDDKSQAETKDGLLAAPPLGMGSVHSSPRSDHNALAPGTESPGPASPATPSAALPPGSPVRQGTMARPKGGRLVEAMKQATISGPPVTVPHLEYPELDGGVLPSDYMPQLPPRSPPVSPAPKATKTEIPADTAAVPESSVEPDLRKEPEAVEAPTSPKNVAKILSTNPVDRKSSDGIAPVPAATAIAAATQATEPAAAVSEAPKAEGKPSEVAPVAAADSQPAPSAPAATAPRTGAVKKRKVGCCIIM
ncbi:Serine/threonine-protein phosphatase 2A activator 1 [Tulasnella sp. UAMH 9824]|nr:Serine/threonine-protein phosphatase 2A activator 1 [Tulasnella sp. UAMH 9824]